MADLDRCFVIHGKVVTVVGPIDEWAGIAALVDGAHPCGDDLVDASLERGSCHGEADILAHVLPSRYLLAPIPHAAARHTFLTHSIPSVSQAIAAGEETH